MKCPKCLKEISDEAFFCGYCGQIIDKGTAAEVSVDGSVSVETETKQKPLENGVNEPKKKSITKKQKKHIGLKILLIFSIVAIVAGTVLGLLTARGIIDLSNIFSSNSFEWTDFSEALNTESEPATSDEESKDKEDDIKTASTTNE